MCISFLGTETPYYYKHTAIPSPPLGYMPIYINHLGRHGSRYMASSKEIKMLLNWLQQCKKFGLLTWSGINLYKNMIELYQASNSKWGMLTKLGYYEQYNIALRLYQKFSSIFDKDKVIYAESTYVLRAQESMHAFLKGLQNYYGEMNIQTHINGVVDPILRFFDLNEEYLQYMHEGSWIEQYHHYINRESLASSFLKQFTNNYNDTSDLSIYIASDIYAVNCNSYNIFCSSKIQNYFSKEQMKYFWQNENCRNYLEKGPAGIDVNLPMDISFALLENFIKTSDIALQSGDIAANLRFAHAETIIPFVGLIKLCSFGKQTNDLYDIPKFWKDTCIAPMAANIQFVFYHCAGKPDLVQILYNEELAMLPIKYFEYGFYEWRMVKEYFKRIIYTPKL